MLKQDLNSKPIAMFAGIAIMSLGISWGNAEGQVVNPNGGGVPVPNCGDDRLQETDCFTVVTNKELFITDPCVVDDPCRTRWDVSFCTLTNQGAWTFGKLAASMAGFPSVDTNPTAVSDFVLKWLSQHLDPQLINGQLIAGRPDMAEFINEWIELSEAMGGPPGQLNMRVAPFRLLAIVNRLDLRDAPSEYGGGNAGEGRFVYNFLNIPDELITALQSGQDVPVDPSRGQRDSEM